MHLHVSLTRTKGRSLGPHKKQCSFENGGALDIKIAPPPTLRRATAEAINRLALTAEAQVRSQSSACNIYGGHSGVGKGFCRNLVLPLVSIIPLTFHIHLHLMLLNQKDKRAKNRKFHTVQVLSHIGEHWTEKGVNTFFLTFKTMIFPAFQTERSCRA